MATTVLKVAWDGENPRVGECIAKKQGRGKSVWVIDRVERIPTEEDGARLLITTHDSKMPFKAKVHPYGRMSQRISVGDPPGVRQDREVGRTAVTAGTWRDPADVTPNAAYKPREVKHWKVACSLTRMARKPGAHITREHIIAADLLREAFDGASVGYTTPRDLGEIMTGLPGPRSGPSEAAKKQVDACKMVIAALRPYSRPQIALLDAILIDNRMVQSWCEYLDIVDPGVWHDPKYYTGMLIACLDILVHHFEDQIERDPD